MKILLICELFPANQDLIFSGGVETYNYYLAKELSKKNSVIVIGRDRTGNYLNRIETKRNLKIIRIGGFNSKIDTSIASFPSRLLFYLLTFIYGLREDFDIVQGNNFVTHPLAFLLGFIKKKPTIAWYPDIFIGKWFRLTGVFSALIGELSERISLILPWSHIIALSKSTEEKLLKRGILKEKITLIYAGVDRKFFQKITTSKKPTFTIICIARFVNYKRIDLLVKAAKLLKEKGSSFRVILVGKGPKEQDIKRSIKNQKLESLFKIYANLPIKNLSQKLKQSDIFCLPSQEEGFGLVVIEAAACGIPYVASDIPVLKEITYQGLGGLFFKSGDEKDLARKIETLIQDKSLRQKLSKEALSLAKQYSWEDIAKRFEDVYLKFTQHSLKILMLIDAWFPHVGGGQVHVWELSKKLSMRGCRVEIFTRNLGKWNKRFGNINVVRVGKIKKFANIFGRIEFLCLALKHALSADYTIVHAHAFSPGLIVPFIKFFRKKKVVYTVHGKGVTIAGLGISSKFLEELVTYRIPYDLEITVAKNTLTKKMAASKLKIIPNGVVIEKFSQAIRVRRKIKKLLYVGRLSYEKGTDLLIQALQNIESQRNLLLGNKLSLTIVGEGQEKRKLEKLANGLAVKFTGRLEGRKLLQEYKKADLLILPSRTEGHPITLFEAWSSKLPVLATDVGDNKRYIKDGVNGFLTKPDMSSLADKLQKIIKNNNLNIIAEQSFKKVQNFSWDRITDQTLKSYQEILHEQAND